VVARFRKGAVNLKEARLLKRKELIQSATQEGVKIGNFSGKGKRKQE